LSIENLPWVVKFKPRTASELAGNKMAINELKLWLRSWDKGIPEKHAAFLVGPSGVGKTVSVQVLARELNFDVLEINASDYRTRTRMEELIGRAATQNITIFGKRRLILFDEMEGISGREDQGGVTAINEIIKQTRSPIILIASSVTEENEEKFRSIRERSNVIEYRPVSTVDVYAKLAVIAKELTLSISPEALESLAVHSQGDLRGAINDLESLSRGKKEISIAEIQGLSERDRKAYTPAIVYNLFASRTLHDARKAISQAFINHEELFDWIYENLPLIFDDPHELAEALNALSRADIFERRAKTFNYRLQKYMYNNMTGGVALSRTNSQGLGLRKQILQSTAKLGYKINSFTFTESNDGLIVKPVKYLGDEWRKVNEGFRLMGATWLRGGGSWIIPYVRPPQLKWRYIRTFSSRKKLQSVSAKVASKLHVDTKTAVSEIIPLMRLMFRSKKTAELVSSWLELEDEETLWMNT
jgi:replication factor C large subunit